VEFQEKIARMMENIVEFPEKNMVSMCVKKEAKLPAVCRK